MKKYLQILMSLCLVLPMFLAPNNYVSATETVNVDDYSTESDEIIEVEVIEFDESNQEESELEESELDEFVLEESDLDINDSLSSSATFPNGQVDENSVNIKAARIGLPNKIEITAARNGDKIDLYITNVGVDTIDSLTGSYTFHRYNENKSWALVQKASITAKNIKPGTKLIKSVSYPKKYGYEKETISFTSKDGKSTTASTVSRFKENNPYNWQTITTLADHTYRHAADFGISKYDEMAYSKKAQTFYNNRKKDGYEYFLGSDNAIRVYQESSNTFASYNSSGKSKTIYKPSGKKTYWETQKKKYKK